jgi:hypothetical protein
MDKTTHSYFLLPVGAALLLLAPLSASAQFGPSKVAEATAAIQPTAIVRGGKGVLRVTLTVKPKYHVNANKPNDSAYIATVFVPQPTPGIVFGPAQYPAAQSITVSYSPKPLLVYRGRVTITVPFAVTRGAAPGVKRLSGTVSFQGCDAASCYPPASAIVKAAVTVK